jgi:hypothetical protein
MDRVAQRNNASKQNGPLIVSRAIKLFRSRIIGQPYWRAIALLEKSRSSCLPLSPDLWVKSHHDGSFFGGRP